MTFNFQPVSEGPRRKKADINHSSTASCSGCSLATRELGCASPGLWKKSKCPDPARGNRKRWRHALAPWWCVSHGILKQVFLSLALGKSSRAFSNMLCPQSALPCRATWYKCHENLVIRLKICFFFIRALGQLMVTRDSRQTLSWRLNLVKNVYMLGSVGCKFIHKISYEGYL